jgi:hypothetical protein
MTKTMNAETEQWAVSLVRGDLLFRLQRKVGLIPEHGLGIVRRALFWSMLAWLPTAVWAWLHGGFVPAEGSEPLLSHFGINARLLLAVPLFIIAEGMMQSTLTGTLPRLVSSGIVPMSERDALRAVLQGIAKLRDSVLPWIAIGAVLIVFFVLAAPDQVPHELAWAKSQSAGDGLGFGAWWYLYVGRTIFLTLLLAWLWRLTLLFVLFKRISGLKLSLVPTHPDRSAGLGFMAKVPVMFAPVVLALSSVFAAGWAHQVVYHDVAIASLRIEIIASVAILSLLFVSPFISFFGLMMRTKKEGLLEYGELIGQHGRLIRERWVDKKSAGNESILDNPEPGQIADMVAPYELISKMRPLPLNLGAMAPLIGAAILPMIVLAAVDLPLKTVLKAVMKILV